MRRKTGPTHLDGEDRYSSRTLSQYPVTREQRLQTEQGVPSSQSSTGQGSSLDEVQVAGKSNETLLVVGSVFLQRTVDHTSSTGSNAIRIDGSGEMSLIKLGDDLVAGLESVDLGSNGFDDSSTV